MKERKEILIDFKCSHCDHYKGRLPICDACCRMQDRRVKYGTDIMVSK